MREHALPQDVVGYRFHIIGNMTLKQFAEVAIGCVIGFVIYSTNLPDLLKWPLILIFAGTGAALAFVPLEERPLDQWATAFFFALYRPTQFYWARLNKIPEPFLYESQNKHQSLVQEVDLTPARRQRVKEYMRSVDTDAEEDVFDKNNSQRLNEVMGAFDQVLHTQTASNVVYQAADVAAPAIQQPQQPDQVIYQVPAEADPSTVVLQNPHLAVAPPTSAAIFTMSQEDPQNARPQPSMPETVRNTSVSVPELQSLHLESTVSDADAMPELAGSNNQQPATYVDSSTIYSVGQVTAGQSAVAVQKKTLPFPQKPTEPNKIVGMVVDPTNAPVSNAIVEILTESGMSARAVKTNVLGQFFITTPLNNGTYSILAEKNGLQFQPLQLVVSGKIIDPIEVRSL